MKYKIILCILLILLILFSFIVKYYYLNNNIEKFTLNNLKDTEFYVLYVPKREKYIKDVMKKIKLEPKFIQGPDKNKLDLQKMIENNELVKKDGIDKNRGRIACHLGHLKILNTFLQSNKKYALIFEDDIFIPQEKNKQIEIGTKIKNLINNIPIDADIVYFGYCFENCSSKYKYNEYFNKSVRPVCRHCYLVSRKGANIIISNTKYINGSGDIRYMKLIEENRLKSYSVNSNHLLIEQNRDNLGTELGNNQKLRACI
jgi:GR25 family glycosyltransferase involved in LPS biosynthesis